MRRNGVRGGFGWMALCGLAVAASAQQPWQKMHMPAAAEVAKVWSAPPAEYGPEPYYGLNGPFDQASITRDLDRMKTLGYQAVTVQFGYGSSYTYLSSEYFKIFRFFVDEAKKRGMKVWIVDDAGYPSGFAGGKFTELRPDLRMQALSVTERVPAAGGSAVNVTLKPETVAVTAVNADDGNTVSIPVAGGAGQKTVSWTAPAGNWTVLVVEHVFSTSPTRSDTNPKRVKDGSQSLEDYLDPAATGQYLEFTHEQYKKYVGDEFGKTIMGFRGDEPDYSIRGLPWTPKFFDRFEQVKGYDIRPYVATLQMPKLTERERRAKADYYDVFSLMFRDGFFKPQGDWCAANRMEYQVHLNHEEMQMELTKSEGEFFRDFKYVQVPGIDSIWHQIFPDTISDFPRLASSVSHVYGRPRAFTESFAAYRPEPSLEVARYVINEQLVRGINLFETMYYPASSTPGREPSPYIRDAGFPALLSYTRRMSYVMAMGRPTAEVALYLPSSAMWLGDADADTAFVASEQMLSERQIDFDIVSEDALGTELKAGNGVFETMSGNRYRTVIVPSTPLISEAMLERLRTFAKGGGRVLFLGRTPGMIAGRTILDARAARPGEFGFARVESTAQLPATPTPPAQPTNTALSPQVVPAAIEAAVGDVVGTREITLDAADTALKVTRRRLKDADVFFFFNEGAQAKGHTVSIRSDAKTVERWDPATGQATRVAATEAGGRVTVKVELEGYGTCLLVAR